MAEATVEADPTSTLTEGEEDLLAEVMIGTTTIMSVTSLSAKYAESMAT